MCDRLLLNFLCYLKKKSELEGKIKVSNLF